MVPWSHLPEIAHLLQTIPAIGHYAANHQASRFATRMRINDFAPPPGAIFNLSLSLSAP
jgi:hypothetical protein